MNIFSYFRCGECGKIDWRWVFWHYWWEVFPSKKMVDAPRCWRDMPELTPLTAVMDKMANKERPNHTVNYIEENSNEGA